MLLTVCSSTYRVRTKFSVVDDDIDGQAVRVRARTKRQGASPQKADSSKEWKTSKSAKRRQNIDLSVVNNSYQIEDAGQITPLPPPLVSS